MEMQRAIPVVALAAACAPAHGQCSNDCGVGDVTEGEACVAVFADRTNDGCNETPNLFNEIVGPFPVTVCGTVSTDVDGRASRDTDWHRIGQAALSAADLDANGVVEVVSTIVSEGPVANFMVAIGDPACSDIAVVGEIGHGTGCASGASARYAIVIADHPDGFVVWNGPGNPDGSGIFTGFPCAGGVNDYVLTIDVVDPPSSCAPGAGACNVPNGSAGCDDPDVDCCVIVCASDPFCCDTDWDQDCADTAVADGCAPGPGDPVDLANGPDPGVEGFLRVSPDAYGHWASTTFGGGGDDYNPVGAETGSEAAFNNGFLLFVNGTHRQALTTNPSWLAVHDDATLDTSVTQPTLTSDENSDGVDDRAVSQFQVTGIGVDLLFDLDQSVTGDGNTGTITQTYTVTNDSGAAVSLELVRAGDFDLLWGAADFADDSVGTNRASTKNSVFQGEDALPETNVTMHSDDADTYTGAKRGIDPDGGGPDPPFDFGTDTEVWDSFGLPPSWENFICGVGYSIDGESGPQPAGCVAPCDGAIYLRIPLFLGDGGSASFTIHHVYGDESAGGCPEDCGDMDGTVGTVDLLALLGQFGGPGPCDIDGSGVVDSVDFLLLLASWGICGMVPDGVPVGSGGSIFDDGFLAVTPDAFGSWAASSFGGIGDFYNPVSFGLDAATFTTGLFVFVGSDRRELLSANETWQTSLGFDGDASLDRAITMPATASDLNGDMLNETINSQFTVTGAGVDLTFSLFQQVEADEESAEATITQQYAITNNHVDPIQFDLVWVGDYNLPWFGDEAGDMVGTESAGAERCSGDCAPIPDGEVSIVDLLLLLAQWGTNASCDVNQDGEVGINDLLDFIPQWGPCDGPSVYVQEFLFPSTRITVSCDQAEAYCGGKNGIDPDGAGGDPPFGLGTSTVIWDERGLPAAWHNHVAGVGTDVNGESGQFPAGCVPPCDAAVYLTIPVSLPGAPPAGSPLGPGSGFYTVRARFGAAGLAE